MPEQSLCKSGRIRIREFDISDPLFRPVRDLYVPPAAAERQPARQREANGFMKALTAGGLL